MSCSNPSCSCQQVSLETILKKIEELECLVGKLSPTMCANYKLGASGNPAAGNIVAIPSLIGKSVLAVFINGPLLIRNTEYTFDINTGDFNFTGRGGTSSGDALSIIYR